MARKYTRMRITHIDIYRLSLFMSGAKILLWCARALSLAHSGFSRSLCHPLGLTPRFIPCSLTRSLPPTLAHWFPYRSSPWPWRYGIMSVGHFGHILLFLPLYAILELPYLHGARHVAR